jgi:hypothetical protein
MAVDIGKSVISQVTNKTFRRLASGAGSAIRSIPDMLQNSSDSGKVSVELGPFGTNNLQFPLDVESGVETGNHGHYIMFYINEQESAKLSMSGPEDREDKAKTSTIEERQKRQVNDFLEENRKEYLFLEEKSYEEGLSVEERKKYERLRGSATDSGPGGVEYTFMGGAKNYATASLKRAPTRRLKTAIALYMPPNVQTTYGAQYTDTEIGTFAESAFDVMDAVSAERYGDAAQATKAALEGVEQLVLKGLLGAAGALPGLGGLREVEAMREGRIFSNRMELAFKGVTKRQFQYTFKMIPKSQREAEEIRKIVNAFKFNMLPEFKGDSTMGRQLTVPNTFDIEYMYNGSHNSYIHKISTCFLENVTVAYGGERYTAHADAGDGTPPTETSITLNFREIETMTRERIAEGY